MKIKRNNINVNRIYQFVVNNHNGGLLKWG